MHIFSLRFRPIFMPSVVSTPRNLAKLSVCNNHFENFYYLTIFLWTSKKGNPPISPTKLNVLFRLTIHKNDNVKQTPFHEKKIVVLKFVKLSDKLIIPFVKAITCSWHQKNETTNLKCWKMSKMKKQGIKCFNE